MHWNCINRAQIEIAATGFGSVDNSFIAVKRAVFDESGLKMSADSRQANLVPRCVKSNLFLVFAVMVQVHC